MQIEPTILYDTRCEFNTQGTLDKKYNFLHYTRNNYMGVWVPDPDAPFCIACDVYAKHGKLNVNFVKEVMAFHKGKHCYLTVELTDLPARWLACTMGFKEVSKNDEFRCYYRLL